jgi:gliding motility-associated-like protein
LNKPLLILFILIGSLAFGQNLVPNPSFEDYDDCPLHPTYEMNNQISNAIGWNHPTTLGTSDYFNSCADDANIWTSVNVPNAFTGFQQAQDGSAYLGFYAYGFTENVYGTEYVQAKLTESLIQGETYKIAFYISLANHSEYAIKEIGAFVSESQISRGDAKNFDFNPQVKSINFISDTTEWTLISGIFEASGQEEYITIGNFKDSISTDTLNTDVFHPVGENYSYYFIDGISLEKYDSTEVLDTVDVLIPNVLTPNDDGVNDIFQLNFSFNKTSILNRWGNLIWSGAMGEYWNGKTQEGNDVSEGTYFYIIETDMDKHQGFVQVIR